MSLEPWADTLDALRTRRARIAVLGLGYVGLPLADALLAAGYPVLGIDIDRSKIDRLARGESYIAAVPSERLRPAVDTGRFVATADLARVRDAQAVIVCVPTPLAADRAPDLSFVEDSTRGLAPHLARGALFVLVSTTYPGTTRLVVKPILEAAGHVIGETLFLAYAPEREDPGNARFHTRDLPRVMGADDVGSRALVEALFAGVVRQLVPVSSSDAAEAAKILENTFRAVNIALVNEMKVILDRLGIDVREVIDAAATKPFGFMAFYPGPGLGGHCIPIDPFYLSWRARQVGEEARFIELAGDVNCAMPGYVLKRLAGALDARGKALRGAQILVLGLAYKADVDDTRESPAFEIIDFLINTGARVAYHDPHVPALPPTRDWSHLPALVSLPLTPQNLATMDAVVIVTDHRAVDYDLVIDSSTLVIDTRGATRHKAARRRHPERVVDA